MKFYIGQKVEVNYPYSKDYEGVQGRVIDTYPNNKGEACYVIEGVWGKGSARGGFHSVYLRPVEDTIFERLLKRP